MGEIREQLIFVHASGSGTVPRSFQGQVRDWIRRAPWFGVSVAVHLLLILALFNVPWARSEGRSSPGITATLPQDVEDTVLTEDTHDDKTEIEKLETEVPDPIITEEPTEELLVNEAVENTPIPTEVSNNVIGLGGGNANGFHGLYRKRGGHPSDEASQRAVAAGLDWLARHQSDDGYWGAESFQDQCEETICTGRGLPTCDVGVTGLALLAFLGAGNTTKTGRYQRVVTDGLRWLKMQQGIEYEGMYGTADGRGFMYNHAIASLAMCEAYGMTRIPMLGHSALQALDFIASARNRYGVWRYSYPPTNRADDNDMSVTGWMIFALCSGVSAGLEVDRASLRAGLEYIEQMTAPATSRTGYNKRGGGSSREDADYDRWPAENVETMTAVAMLCRMLLLEDKSVEPDEVPVLQKGAKLLAKRPPRWEQGHIDYYYWYYGSYAMYQMSGRLWDGWQRAMEPSIIKHQRKDGDARGSWDPDVDPWGDHGGRVYATALAVLCLEVYYRYDRILGAR